MLKDIYFFNPRKLAERIRVGEIGQLIQLKHFIIFSILFYSGFSLPIIIASESSDINEWVEYFLFFLAEAAINYYGIYYTYQINQKGDGQNYFGRLFCLALPVSIKLFIYSLLISLIISSLLFSKPAWEVDSNQYMLTIISFVGPCVYSIAFYLLIGKYIRICSSNS
ncbi:hypothetical protein [Cellvibrio sp. pealriver]|uniref:hypothetical protein n=1 Tax=Cellvibrio sp. pealriver TaxID=1622269 RepID=UPI00066FEA57|nr:hypothetical protein [Cellvibrio sp. pealriver]